MCIRKIGNSCTAVQETRVEAEKSLKTIVITSLALIAIALFLIGLSRIGTGLSYIPSVRITGFAFIYNFAAIHVFFLGVSVGVVGIIAALIAGYKSRNLPDQELYSQELDSHEIGSHLNN